jgi:SlyX protein
MTGRDELAERIVELETRLAHQDETLRELSDVVSAQWSKIDALQLRIEELRERLMQQADEIRDPSEEPPPPHY